MRTFCAFSLLAFAACSGSSSSSPSSEAAGSVSEASTFVACEDVCSECDEVHCHSGRYQCISPGAGYGCPPQGFPRLSIACLCCADNECLVGSPQTGQCVACPAGQVCDPDQNTCCTPLTKAQACGNSCGVTVSDGCGHTYGCSCPGGQTCNAGACCTPLTQAQACGTRLCGTVSNGCGGTWSCGNCGLHEYCSTFGTCMCSWPYHDCGDGVCRTGACP